MSAAKILLVDDDPSAIQLMGSILAGMGELRFATNGEDALRLVRESVPDLILLDAEMPGMGGFEVCEVLQADHSLAHIPVIFVTSNNETAFEVAGFELGAVDFIGKPVSAPLVRARARTHLRLKRLSDELRRYSMIDSLTGLANRRRFDESLAREWAQARRTEQALSMLMVDVDHFKRFNDHYGHPAGDDCLVAVADALLGAILRPTDLVARYGGEEFALVLPQTPRAGAERLARRLIDAVESLKIPHQDSPTAPHITVSVGVACYDETSSCWLGAPQDSRFADDPQAGCSHMSLLKAADHALYAAKQGGRAQFQLRGMDASCV